MLNCAGIAKLLITCWSPHDADLIFVSCCYGSNILMSSCWCFQSDQSSSGFEASRPDASLLATSHRQHCPNLLYILHHIWHPRSAGIDFACGIQVGGVGRCYRAYKVVQVTRNTQANISLPPPQNNAMHIVIIFVVLGVQVCCWLSLTW